LALLFTDLAVAVLVQAFNDGVAHALGQGLEPTAVLECLEARLGFLGTDVAITVGVQSLEDRNALAPILLGWGLALKGAREKGGGAQGQEGSG
jgi:hypothetical protein